jgi:hypothetical protein
VIFQNFVRAFLKAAGHRYIKRIPYNTPRGRRYRYIYRTTSTHQGRHAFDAEHLVEGTKFALHGEGESEFHGHITAVNGDMIKYVIDDGPRKGEEVTTSRQRLVDELNLVHGVQDKLTAERAKVKAAIAEARRAGHTGVVRRLERRLRALGGEPEAQPTEPRASGVADLIEAHRVGLLERAGALKEQWGALDRQADKEEIARLRDEEGALRGAALLAARAQRDGVDGFGAELQKLIDRIQASIERSDDAEHKARLTRDLEQRRQLLAIVEGAKPEAQPAEPEPEAQPAEPAEREAENVGGLSDEEVKEMDDAVDRFRFTPEEIQNMSLDELKETYETMWKVVYAHRNKSSKTPEYQRLHEAIEGARAIADADRDLPRTDVHAAEDALSAFEERYTERYVTPLRSLIKPIDERLTRLQRNKRARERRAEKKQRTQAQAERQARREERERKKREEQARIDEATARRMLTQDEAREMQGLARRYSEAQPAEPTESVEPSEDNFETMPEAEPEAQNDEPTPEEIAEINRRAGERLARDRAERQERERARVRERSFHKLPSHDDARDNHLIDNTRNLRGARDTRERLRGADPKAVSKAIDAPIPIDGSVKRYPLPNDGGLAVRVSGAGLSYQFRFPDGTVSDEHTLAVDLSKMNEKASIKIAQGLAASYYGGVNDKGEPRYFTPATQTDAELRRTTLADVARLNKAERDFDGFSELTEETRVQRDALDPITPRSDEINSLEDIDKKTLAMLKRIRSKDKTRASMRQAARQGDGIFATDGHRIFYRRGMNFGEDRKPVAIDDKATKDELDQRPPNYATIVSGVERDNVHAGTMSKETAKQLARALKISEGKKINESLVIRADREDSTLTFIHKGREIAKIPKADDMVEGDFVVSADYFHDALRDGGAVSVHLSPENPKAQYNPIRLTTMSGSHVIMPMRNP